MAVYPLGRVRVAWRGERLGASETWSESSRPASPCKYKKASVQIARANLHGACKYKIINRDL